MELSQSSRYIDCRQLPVFPSNNCLSQSSWYIDCRQLPVFPSNNCLQILNFMNVYPWMLWTLSCIFGKVYLQNFLKCMWRLLWSDLPLWFRQSKFRAFWTASKYSANPTLFTHMVCFNIPYNYISHRHKAVLTRTSESCVYKMWPRQSHLQTFNFLIVFTIKRITVT